MLDRLVPVALSEIDADKCFVRGLPERVRADRGERGVDRGTETAVVGKAGAECLQAVQPQVAETALFWPEPVVVPLGKQVVVKVAVQRPGELVLVQHRAGRQQLRG